MPKRTKSRGTYIPVAKKSINLGQPMSQIKKVTENREEEDRLIAEVVEKAKREGTYGRYYSQPMQRITRKQSL